MWPDAVAHRRTALWGGLRSMIRIRHIMEYLWILRPSQTPAVSFDRGERQVMFARPRLFGSIVFRASRAPRSSRETWSFFEVGILTGSIAAPSEFRSPAGRGRSTGGRFRRGPICGFAARP